MDDKEIILEEYRIYMDTKERYIDRQFRSNNFFLVLNLIILAVVNLFSLLTPQYPPVIIGSLIGAVSSVMWWMGVDSYQMLIKVKYAKVLEYLETKLPEQPCLKEYAEYKDMKKKENLIVFGDLQKTLTVIIICIYFIIITFNIFNMIKDFTMANM